MYIHISESVISLKKITFKNTWDILNFCPCYFITEVCFYEQINFF